MVQELELILLYRRGVCGCMHVRVFVYRTLIAFPYLLLDCDINNLLYYLG